MPAFATWLGIGGSATLQCRADEDGHPFNCRVIAESPPGLGFGAAARLVAASGTIRAARSGERIVGGSFRTRVNFTVEAFPSAPGRQSSLPAPTPEVLALARQVVSGADDPTEESWDRLDGLDHDRRAVVSAWIDELMPFSEADLKEVRAVQLTHLFSERDLKRILRGEKVSTPTQEAFMASIPAETPRELDALKELRRRYCSRYEC
ncbi:hypothetical protein [Brevundimonas sp. SORGH_AS_0993]|uniref:hypothetical protein n=1 Tax=Brevundimonas sp. SORGH_AS_0993 TaxID=3041794 RepID=UPI00278B539C|nr:hypothetical protein [Brevundimonas sp. SORGH_AS_0993]MDQ1154977.1 hypothetical protein [Brevundimonas sp. SORGH_AS_0993]